MDKWQPLSNTHGEITGEEVNHLVRENLHYNQLAEIAHKTVIRWMAVTGAVQSPIAWVELIRQVTLALEEAYKLGNTEGQQSPTPQPTEGKELHHHDTPD